MNGPEELAARLEAIEQRLDRLEGLLGPGSGSPHGDDKSGPPLEFSFEELTPRPDKARRWTAPPTKPFPVTELLGWGGVAALVLAAAYLVKLGIDLGWLTPARQVLIAALGGLGLIGAGTALRGADHHYASLLPAGGVATLFISAYGAHLYYRLIPFAAAIAAVVAICLVALWLCHLFRSELYAFLAVAGSYSAPLLLDGLRTGVGELALYYLVWSLLFCIYGIWFGRRGIYLMAAYLALIGFDVVWYTQWRNQLRPPWMAALILQSLQGVIFAAGTTLFSLMRRDPLDRTAAWAHLPPLLIFYVLEYALLNRYLPEWAPWIAILSAGVVGGLYWLAHSEFGGRLPGGRLLLSVYVAVVLFHAGYLEALPDEWQPWAGLAAGTVLAAWLMMQRIEPHAQGAILGALGLIFVINLMRATLDFNLDRVAGGDWLALAYAVELYIGYALARRGNLLRLARGFLVYCGHLSSMAAAVNLFDSRLTVSTCWAILAVASLALALRLGDRLLAQSSLLVFAFSGIKVLIYDLAGAAPLVRIGSLVILGISLYVGGWLYRKIPIEADGPRDASGCNLTSV